ncbi:MAG: 2-succinyl-5-enolpyruvyl-6-hydroxy-3-cyclohexene-1-carboxylic-acid synthase [Oceanipulchritudo sp.]
MASRIARQAGAANLPFGVLVVQTLRRLGVDHFVVSPGSRSTPLALAAGELGDAGHTVCLDERSAAFHALGRIKATRRPVALVCTSGTAAAHYYPAVIEARETALPLLILSADRPPELRHCHAGQTIDQTKLFGSTARLYAELPLPEPDSFLARQVREICRTALETALGQPHGPVHLNCPFREPFFPLEGDVENPSRERIEALLASLEPVGPATSVVAGTRVLPERTLVLAGPRPWRDPLTEEEALLDFCREHGIPLLADGANPLRYRAGGTVPVIIHYDRMLRDDRAWEDLKPEAVILWGEPPTSKVLRKRLGEVDLRGYQSGHGIGGLNPFQGGIERVDSSLEPFLKTVTIPSGAGAFAVSWAGRDRYFEQRLAEDLRQPHGLFEGDVHRLLGSVLPAGTPVVFASSLAVRDADWFMPRREEPLIPFSQRGANGIDGTLSLARGVAAGGSRGSVLVTGDLAFLHDTNGLLGAGADRYGLLVILLNNQGGGIFDFLPVAGKAETYEALFATPQAVDFKGLVEAHGGQYALVESVAHLQSLVAGWRGPGLTVLEVRIDREVSQKLHRRYLEG